MAELLVKVDTGEVVFVGEDGHQWGRRESREVYDAYVLQHGVAPTVKVRSVLVMDLPIIDPKTKEPIKDRQGKVVTVKENIPISETEEPLPPPNRLGVVKIPGEPAENYKYLAEFNEQGERPHRIPLSPKNKEDILSRSVRVNKTTFDSVVGVKVDENKTLNPETLSTGLTYDD